MGVPGRQSPHPGLRSQFRSEKARYLFPSSQRQVLGEGKACRHEVIAVPDRYHGTVTVTRVPVAFPRHVKPEDLRDEVSGLLPQPARLAHVARMFLQKGRNSEAPDVHRIEAGHLALVRAHALEKVALTAVVGKAATATEVLPVEGPSTHVLTHRDPRPRTAPERLVEPGCVPTVTDVIVSKARHGGIVD